MNRDNIKAGASYALELGFAALIGGLIALQFTPPNYGPRLVGFECLGASGPIYADSESDFPPCAHIANTKGQAR
jgi:hypothetical protein